MKNDLLLPLQNVKKGSLILLSFFLFAACMQHEENLVPRIPQSELLTTHSETGGVSAMNKRTFTAHLTGDEEVPANDSQGQGQVIFRLNEDGTEMYYKLIVANIDNVRAAHIHCGEVGANGPVVVGLFGTPTEGVYNGVLAEGIITDANVNPLSCIGGTKSLAAVLELIRNGGAYVNVHTTALPGGEIRGQIR